MNTYYVRTDGSDSNTGLANDAAHAWLTIAKALATVAIGDIAYIVGGPFLVGTGLAASNTFGGVGYSAKTRLIGCTATPGDGGKPVIRATAGITLLTTSGYGWSFESLDFDGNNVASCRGVAYSQNYNAIFNCKLRNFTNSAIYLGASWISMGQLEVTGCSGSSAVYILGSNTSTPILDSWIHDNSTTAIDASGANETHVLNCVITNNTGASSDGINSQIGSIIRNCVIHGNGRHGIALQANYLSIHNSIQNNIITSNGGYGIKFLTAPVTTISQQIDYNAYYNNTSGAVNNLSQSAHDVTLTADPYTNASGNDFSLNSTAGGGAACRAAGFPGTLPGGLTTGYLDIGAAQHADPTGVSPSTPTFTLTDNADGTGATATISGSDAGSTNTVYTATWSGGTVGAWISGGSRTGDGTVSLSLSIGYYLVYVHSVLSGQSSSSQAVLVLVTTGASRSYTSNKGLTLQALATLVQGLAPAGLANNEVVVREDIVQNDTDLLRGVSVVDMGEQYGEGTNGTQDVGYICGLAFVKFRPRGAVLEDDMLQMWYETVRRKVVDARLSVNLTVGSPKQHVMILQPGRTLTNPKKWPNYFVRQMVVAVWHRENNP